MIVKLETIIHPYRNFRLLVDYLLRVALGSWQKKSSNIGQVFCSWRSNRRIAG